MRYVASLHKTSKNDLYEHPTLLFALFRMFLATVGYINPLLSASPLLFNNHHDIYLKLVTQS
jgi:hypothetical protein